MTHLYKILNANFLPKEFIGNIYKGKQDGNMIRVFIPEFNYVLFNIDEVEEVK